MGFDGQTFLGRNLSECSTDRHARPNRKSQIGQSVNVPWTDRQEIWREIYGGNSISESSARHATSFFPPLKAVIARRIYYP